MGQFVFWMTINTIIQSTIVFNQGYNFVSIIVMYLLSLVFANLHLESKD